MTHKAFLQILVAANTVKNSLCTLYNLNYLLIIIYYYSNLEFACKS